MQGLRVHLPASPSNIRAWLHSFIDRILPIVPEPGALGQPQLSVYSFLTRVRLRPQSGVPSEITDVGGFCVGLDMAFPSGEGWLQSVGPVVAFLVVPMGLELSEVRILFPIPVTNESLKQVVAQLKASWPGIEIRRDDPPWWVFRDFNRRELFEALATGGPPPPGAPPRWDRAEPWPDTSPPPHVTATPQPLITEDADRPLTEDAERLLTEDAVVKAMIKAVSDAKAEGRSTAKSAIGKATSYSPRHLLRKVHEIGFPNWKAFTAWVPARRPD